MKKLFAFVMLLSMMHGAHAGTITITIGTVSGVCAANGCSKSYSASDAEIARIVPAYQIACNAKKNSACAQKEVLAFWADAIISDVVNAVSTLEKQTLQDGATSGYTPIKPQ